MGMGNEMGTRISLFIFFFCCELCSVVTTYIFGLKLYRAKRLHHMECPEKDGNACKGWKLSWNMGIEMSHDECPLRYIQD